MMYVLSQFKLTILSFHTHNYTESKEMYTILFKYNHQSQGGFDI